MVHPDGGEATLLWAQLAVDAPEGLAVVNSEGQFIRLNHAGVRLCGRTEAELSGTAAPFLLATDSGSEPDQLLDERSTELVTTWSPPGGVQCEFAYRVRHVPSDPSLTLVAFRDVTDEQHRQRRVAAIARTSAKLACQDSLTATLDALASEVLQTDALAGVQILTHDDAGDDLRIMGSAGFRRWPDFFDRLMECRQRGAPLQMLDALQQNQPVMVAGRWTAIRDDPAWEPLHDYLGELHWESFASLPLTTRGHTVGVLNAFFAPKQVIDQRTLEFLSAMAEQAAIAIDYAALMQQKRDVARREERQRLARDLHDSIVQQVFSMSMQAKSLEEVGQRGAPIPVEAVRTIAGEVSSLSHAVLADLRAMVHELRPSSLAELGGLEEALRALVDSITTRARLYSSLSVAPGLEQIKGAIAEDVYRIIAEAIHNVAKHAEADNISIRLTLRDNRLEATVTDDGRGVEATQKQPRSTSPAAGYGLKTMRERAEHCGGTLIVEPRKGSGTIVRLTVPVEVPLVVEGGPGH